MRAGGTTIETKQSRTQIGLVILAVLPIFLMTFKKKSKDPVMYRSTNAVTTLSGCLGLIITKLIHFHCMSSCLEQNIPRYNCGHKCYQEFSSTNAAHH
eukprot:m.99066 g.99066  ORF g.99066 m.99066 type:complete len:98 (+) comp13661_c1_seq2:806-1099(+)